MVLVPPKVPYIVYQDEWTTVCCGEITQVAKSAFVHPYMFDMCMTSVPYLRQRRYSDDAWGWEESISEWLGHMHEVSKLVGMGLKPTGTYWFNSGDKWGGSNSGSDYGDKRFNEAPEGFKDIKKSQLAKDNINRKGNLMMLPERVVMKLADEKIFTLLNKIIWWKPNRAVQSYQRKFVDTYEPLYLMCKYGHEADYKFNRKEIGVEVRGEMDIVSQQEDDEYEELAEQMSLSHSMPELWKPIYDADHAPPRDMKAEYEYWYENVRRKQSWHDHKDDNESGQHFDQGRSKVLSSPYGANPGDVWSVPTKSDPYFGKNGIPPQRRWPAWPTDLCTIPILASTDTGDLVFDPFAGSGSLGVAAKLLGRKSFLVDVDLESCRIAAERVVKTQAPLQGQQVGLI